MTDPSTTPDTTTVRDLVGIGLGPFGLGLAALAEPFVRSKEILAEFLDQREEFCWHPGLLLPHATIQVPFLADLVTHADPTSKYSFLNYLKQNGRIYAHYIRASFYPLRSEYSQYCAWVAEQLDTVRWRRRVTAVTPEGQLWRVTSTAPDGSDPESVLARNVVSAVGTEPFIPAPLQAPAGTPQILHSADYLYHRAEITAADSVTIVGSGQSAAEIYRDLIEEFARTGRRLDWFTRSPRFFPMEYTKLTLEMTSPEYAAHHHGLSIATRDRLSRKQRSLHKGISADLIDDIFDTLYRLSVHRRPDTTLRAGVEVSRADPHTPTTDGSRGQHRIHIRNRETGATGIHGTDVLILATGYRPPEMPPFLDGAETVRQDQCGRLDVGLDFDLDDAGTLFTLNGEEHTHGLSAPDLGMGAWRNSIILNRILGREAYAVERHIAFQTFGGENL